MWFTPPKLPVLNLRLRTFEGGGSLPSQFYGVTEDGRPIYVRYRGGWIKISQGDVGASQDDPMEELLSARVGPPLHGAIVAEQACEILGLIVPDMQSMSRERLIEGRKYANIQDLSGRTKFWDEFIYTTEAGLPTIFSALQEIDCPQTVFALSKSAGPNRYRRIASLTDADYLQAWIGFGSMPDAIDRLNLDSQTDPLKWDWLFPGLLKIKFDSVRTKYANQKEHDRGFAISGAHWIWASLSCPTSAGPKQDLAMEIVAKIQSQVEMGVDLVDIETKAVIRQDEVWYSRDVHNWCLEAPNHVIGFRSEYVGAGKFDAWAMRPMAR